MTICSTGSGELFLFDQVVSQFIQNVIKVGIVTARAGICGMALFGTGRRNSLLDFIVMSKRGDFFLRNQNFVTDGAVLTLGQTGFGAGGFLGRIHHYGVTRGIHIAVGVGIVAAGASVSSEALLGTGGGGDNAPIVMAQSINSLLSNQNIAAYGAVLALGQTGFGTGGCHCRIDHFGMTLGVHIAVGVGIVAAGASVGSEALLGTGGGGDGAPIVMAQSVNSLLSNQNIAAYGAVLALGQASLGAGRSHGRVGDFNVQAAVAAGGAAAVLPSMLGFFHSNLAAAAPSLAVLVGSPGPDFLAGVVIGILFGGLLSDQNFVTDGAMLALGQAGFGAGGCHCRIDHFGVTLGRDNFLSDQNFVTDRAVLAFGQTGFGAGGFLGLVDHFGVTLGRDNFLSDQNFVTDRAVLAFGQTGFGAGGFLGLVDHFGVTLGQDNFLSEQNIAAYGAVLALGQAVCGTGGCHCRIDHFGVTQRIHIGIDIAVTTARAGVGGVALLGAGRCGDNRIIAVYVPR